MMKRMAVLLVAAFALGSAYAGTQYELKCATKGCDFVAGIGIGGGMAFEQASGYCAKCGKVVSVTWKRGSKNRPVHMRFWDPFTGRIRAILDCPQCKGPFVKVDQIEDFKHCPKCGKESLRATRRLLYD